MENQDVILLSARQALTKRRTFYPLKAPDSDGASLLEFSLSRADKQPHHGQKPVDMPKTTLTQFVLKVLHNESIGTETQRELLVALTDKLAGIVKTEPIEIEKVEAELRDLGLIEVVRLEEEAWRRTTSLEIRLLFGKEALPHHKRVFQKSFPANTRNVMVLFPEKQGQVKQNLAYKIHDDYLPVWNWLAVCCRIQRLSAISQLPKATVITAVATLITVAEQMAKIKPAESVLATEPEPTPTLTTWQRLKQKLFRNKDQKDAQ
ncbi:TPA: hypothetical protein DF272_01245 [Candidatus Falkowbacteria bacterium]|nr:hypothetical protein [Candidatus Falkowbacteria bacterium]